MIAEKFSIGFGARKHDTILASISNYERRFIAGHLDLRGGYRSSDRRKSGGYYFHLDAPRAH
jgi:hypothetical protein